MPNTHPDSLEPQRVADYEGRTAPLGDHVVAFEKQPAGYPPHELWHGLPDDHCPCPHFGYVIRGSFKVSYADGRPEETVTAGSAYRLDPGHLVTMLEETETVEFSPAGEFGAVMEHVMRNAASLTGA